MNLSGKRKFLMSVFFLVFNTFLAYGAMKTADPQGALIGLASFVGTQSAGIAAFVYGNVKEHEHKNGKS